MGDTRKKIILCPNAGRDLGFEMTRKVDAMLKKHGRGTVLCPVFDDDFIIDLPSVLQRYLMFRVFYRFYNGLTDKNIYGSFISVNFCLNVRERTKILLRGSGERVPECFKN